MGIGASAIYLLFPSLRNGYPELKEVSFAMDQGAFLKHFFSIMKTKIE